MVNFNKFAWFGILLFSCLFSASARKMHPFISEKASAEEKRGAAHEKTTDSEPMLAGVQQLTYAGLRAGESYFNSDGTQMIFQSERDPKNPFYQIFLMNLQNGTSRQVSPGIGKTTCSWVHPNGKKVLFASTHEDPEALKKQADEIALRQSGGARRYEWDFDETYEIYQANTQGKNLRKLTNAVGYDAEGSYSPDGKYIAFASNRLAYSEPLSEEEQAIFAKDKSYFMDIFIMKADGTNVQRLTSTPGYDGGPFFNKEGNLITWRRFSPDGKSAEIFTMNIDGSDQRQLTRLGAMSWAPFFHPSGDYLIFGTNIHGHANFELYLVRADGTGDPKRVTFTDGFDGLPVFLPDGRHIAWTSTRTPGKKSQIFIADWNDTLARQTLRLDAEKPDPTKLKSEINEDDIEQHISYLASDTLSGRLTGTKGEELAAAYVSEIFDALRLQPVVNNQFLQNFEFTSGVSLDDGNRLTIHAKQQDMEGILRADYIPIAFSNDGKFEKANIVFGGYGIIAPKSDKFPEYNSFTHLDVKDKWVLVYRYLPENISVEHRQHLHRYSDLRQKAMQARNLGALGLLVVSGPNARVNEQLIPLRADVNTASSQIFALSISDNVGEKILNASGHNLKTLQDNLDKGDAVMGFDTLTAISGTVALKKEKKRGTNIVARLKAHSSSRNNEAIVIGAHLDHLGKSEDGIFHGADDNASGSAVVLELAHALTQGYRSRALALKRDIIFALWSGEELGLLGSTAFVKSLGESLRMENGSKVVANINLDMVGRLSNQVMVQGAGSSSIWAKMIEQNKNVFSHSIIMQEDPYLPTDSTAFYIAGIPAINFFTGSHEDYHLPSDTSDKINADGVADISRLVAKIAETLSKQVETPDYIKVESPRGGGQTGFRVYLGTIPDYTAENVDGVKLSGVKAGSPAEKCGLKAGDIITKIAGQRVGNVYDYTYVLSALKVAVEVELVFKRGQEVITTKITPESRS